MSLVYVKVGRTAQMAIRNYIRYDSIQNDNTRDDINHNMKL
jgi:hypothetical protein